MLCCVPHCTSEAASTPQVLFPREIPLRHRWQQLIQKGAGVTLSSDQPQEICIKHFVNPDNYAYQEPVLFTDSRGQPIKLATCRLCQKVQRESSMYQLEQKMMGQSLAAVVSKTLYLRMKPSDYLQRLCQQCLIKIDLIRRLQAQYTDLELKYQRMTKMRASLEVIEPAVAEKDQDVELYVPEELVEYLEEVCHEEVLDPAVDMRKVLEQINAANDSEQHKIQVGWEIELESRTGLSLSPKKTVETSVPPPPAAPNGVKPKRKYITQKRSRPAKKKEPAPVPPDGVKPKRKYKTRDRPKPPKRIIHLNDTSSKTCQICRKLFPRREELLDHLLESHATPEGYSCAECDGKPFETVIVYNTHLKFHDATERFYKCSFCAMRYCHRTTQHRHENIVHGMTHPIKMLKKQKTHKSNYQCEQCGKLLSSQYTMDRHMQVHQGAVQCDICHKTVRSTSHLRIHKLRHVNQQPYRCTICDKRYAGKHSLKTHMIEIHEQKQAYQCRICKEAFDNRTEFRNHTLKVHSLKLDRDHHGDRLRFSCLLCPEVSPNLNDLVAHVESSHAGQEYPYKACELCPEEKFVAETALTLHRQLIHRPVRGKRGKRKEDEEAAAVEEQEEEACAEAAAAVDTLSAYYD